MNGCHLFVEEMVDMACSDRPKEQIIEVATLMLRSVLEDHPARARMNLEGFRKSLLYPEQYTSSEDGLEVSPYDAGERAGKALGQAMNRKMDKTTLRKTLRAILCES